ncbi:MAG TPA: hypothetical protein VFO29_02095 [Candidatus Rubrimentiphilum sp.]|nr:hypothetical protein [Candidatus Rubrimentiphilum sp.]
MKYVLAAAIVLVVALLAFHLAGASPAKTQMITYKAAGMKASGKAVNGYCWTGSIASSSANAYRCMVGNNIMDPCFFVSNKVVNCPQDLAANTGTVINLTKPLPMNKGWKGNKPWRYQVAGGSGIMCSAGTGTVIANYPYYCDGNIVCSAPQPSKLPGAYVVQCGTPTGPMSVKNKRTFFVMTAWN